MEIAGLEEASRLLGGAVLGPQKLAAALGFDPLAALREDERPAVARIPFGAADRERLLSRAWDWSRSETIDRGYASLGEFGPDGLRVIAYSAAVRFGTLGVCPQR